MLKKTLVSGFVYHNKKVLLLKRNKNKKYFPEHYERPGGHLEKIDSSLEQAISREILEETGLDINIGKMYFTYSNKIDKISYTEHSFLVQLNELEHKIKLSEDEHVSYKWVSQEKLDNYKIDVNEKKAILAGFKTLY